MLEAILGLDALGHVTFDKMVRRCIEVACISVNDVWQTSYPHEWDTEWLSQAMLCHNPMWVKERESREQQEKHRLHQAHLARADRKHVIRVVINDVYRMGLKGLYMPLSSIGFNNFLYRQFQMWEVPLFVNRYVGMLFWLVYP